MIDEWGEEAAEDPDEYTAENIFWVPKEARWARLKEQARQPTIGQIVDDAMVAIERDNPAIKDVLPKNYARQGLDKTRLGQLIDLVSNIQVGDAEARSMDVLGRVYEYFLGQFATAEGKKGELATGRKTNVVQARSFAEMLEQTILRYQNRAIEAAQVIEELIALTQEIREADARGESLNLSTDELAFDDALSVNDSAVKVLGDDTLRDIARELVETVRNNVTIDWTIRENVRAHLRRLVRRTLRKHGYPPDKQEKATLTVLEQAEALSAGWAS